MCRPRHLKSVPNHSQQGFALFIVLMIMIVVALLVVAATQSYNTEQRIGSNDSDRKYTFALSEAALRQGENDILNFSEDEATAFTENCTDGLCTAVGSSTPSGDDTITVSGTPTVQAWERKCGNSLCIDTNGRQYNTNKTGRSPRYIIEFININDDGAYIYRVTAKAWGQNANTSVITQSYVAYE